MALDVSRLSVPDALVALRSFPRRYREVLRSFEGDDNIEAMARRIGPRGTSAIDDTYDTVRTLELLGQSLQQVLVHDGPVLHAGTLDPAERVWPEAPDEPIDSLLQQLTAAATRLADAVDRVGAEEWTRSATLTGSDRKVTALDLLREAVRTGSDNLRAAEADLADARR